MKKDCWNWKKCKNRKGYGQIRIDGKLKIAHRVIWEAIHGPIPKGMLVCHHCDNPSCINPKHLFLGTNRDNILDSVSKGRWAKGRQCRGKAKLTESDIRTIRASTEKRGILAKRYNINPNMIYKIKHYHIWKHII